MTRSIRETALRLARSGAAGVLATATDLGVLWLLVLLAGMTPVQAGRPSLILGSIVMFLGQKYFVFDARKASTLWRETGLYVIVQIVGMVLTNWLFKAALGLSPRLAPHYLIMRMVVNNLIWVFYFFPLWHFVFKSPAKVGEARAVPVSVSVASVAPEIDGQ